jgi:hypothetical protein
MVILFYFILFIYLFILVSKNLIVFWKRVGDQGVWVEAGFFFFFVVVVVVKPRGRQTLSE